MDSTTFTRTRQLSLLDDAPQRPAPRPARTPPHNHSDTSRVAAESAAPRAPRRREILLGIIRGRGVAGATIDELQAATGWLVQSICPVVHSLAEAGEIRDSGQRRATRAGAAAKAWTATEAAL